MGRINDINNSGNQERDTLETIVLIEEVNNAQRNFKILDNKYNAIKMSIPFPETQRYAVAYSYEENASIQYEKSRNMRYWDELDFLDQYLKEYSLYCGHFRRYNKDYFVMDGNCPSQIINEPSGESFQLINANDFNYNQLVRYWRYPQDYKEIEFSRNVDLIKRKVVNVDIVYDKNNVLYSQITDSYLKKALLRNKDSNYATSVIQTIQKKQDDIRTYPTNESFIVQGCAGSGKTMVLLHRLRYLIFNGLIKNNDYIFLMPGENFKEFIDKTASQFNINKNRIVSYQGYYARLCDKILVPENIKNELVFPPEYLEFVYSESFIRTVYEEFMNRISEQTDSLIATCEKLLVDLSEKKSKEIRDNLSKEEKKYYKEINQIKNKISRIVSLEPVDSTEKIDILLKKLDLKKEEIKQRIDDFDIEKAKKNLNAEDLIYDEHLELLKKEIEKAQIALESASRFTKKSYQKKLDGLNKQLNSYKSNLDNSKSLKKKNAERIAQLKKENKNNIKSIQKIEETIELIKEKKSELCDIVSTLTKEIDELDSQLEQEYLEQIDFLNNFIEQSMNIFARTNPLISNLKPCNDLIDELVKKGLELIECFNIDLFNKNKKDLQKSNLFNERTKQQQLSYIQVLFFNVCKQQIRAEYNIKICDIYKHYWYLLLYSRYLCGYVINAPVNYIFIDEAQDLSPNEIKLIKLVNTINSFLQVKQPVMNFFGDVDQTISLHGTKNWKDIDESIEKFTLFENFRNTNQIVDYCTERLPFEMTKIGLDMDKVSTYENVEDAVYKIKNNDNVIMIVKDEYAKSDLIEFLNTYSYQSSNIYTVKEVKGLEFREVYVFTRGMTDNEKYIAFTRPLVKLNVVSTLPILAPRTKLVVEGDENGEVNPDDDQLLKQSTDSDKQNNVEEKDLESIDTQENEVKENKVVEMGKNSQLTDNNSLVNEISFSGQLLTQSTIYDDQNNVKEDTPEDLKNIGAQEVEKVNKSVEDKTNPPFTNSNFIFKEVMGRITGQYYLIQFSGKLKKYTSNLTEARYIPVMRKNKEKHLPVFIDEIDCKMYITENNYKSYKKELSEMEILEII